MKKRPKKIIPWRRHHLRFDVTIWKAKSPCRQAEEVEVVDAVVALIFHRAAMKKTNPPCPLAIAGEKEEEINLQYQKNLA
jgi:hypothetical protein